MPLLTSRLISKESHQSPKGDCEVFWQFDKCTLLSSQGSDAPAFRSLDRLRRATPILFFAVACRIGAFRSESKQPDSVSRREIRCPAFRLTASRGATSLSYPSLSACQIGCPGLFSVSGSTLRQLRGVRTSIVDPKVDTLKRASDGGWFST